jgi:hypothetical protein
MKQIGIIQQLQIQKNPLKSGVGLLRTYDPSLVQSVPTLRLTQRGVFGLADAGDEIMDVHHIDHPRSRNRGNTNGISFGFTQSYQRMKAQFGETIWLGCAGENIIIEATDLTAIGETIIIGQDDHQIKLNDVMIAPPCDAFSRFVTAERSLRGSAMKSTLQFLGDGTRGYYATLCIQHDDALIHVGDAVFVPD